jgi:4-amino-4-deoxy-L-arabinose transferase-like glycosyltransferase
MPFGRAVLGIAGAALLLRVGFVLWAPAGLVSDADYYHGHALALLNGNGYTNADGSPAILWMPGWPAFLAGLYGLFGPSVRAAQLANAALGAATTVLVCLLGARLFDRRIALAGGWIYALWPGVLFYAAVLFTETLFTALFAACLLLVVIAAQTGRGAWLAAAAAALAATLWVRSEPIAFLPVFAWFLARARGSWRRGALEAGLLAAVMLVAVSPWTVRNARAFGRLIPTSANGGTVFYEGNHAGASGGNDLPAMLEFRARFAHLPLGEGDVERGAAGWREGLAFVRDHPGEALAIGSRKLWVTYSSDDRAPVLIRGFEGPRRILDSHYIPLRGYVPESTMLWLQRAANAYWLALLALAGVGASRAARWRGETRVLVFGVLGTWVAIHFVMIGGARFHVPEAPLLALLAGGGGVALLDAVLAKPVE